MTSAPAGFTGIFLSPRDDGYELARKVWNAMHDRQPTAIVRCSSAADVALAVQYAATLGLPVTVRGGGHNVAGAAIADNALMIDLSLMREVTIDVSGRQAYADGGCLLGDVDRATTPYGLACPSGVVSHTGLGGLALGGGYGWLARKWGLTCDHILSVQVVLADGAIVEASPARNRDLFWAACGGGGGFGVVTRFTLRLRPVAPMYYRSVMFGLEAAGAALGRYRDFAPGQPDDLHVVGCGRIAGYQDSVPAALHGAPVVVLTALHTGDPADGPAAVAGLFGGLTAAASGERVISHADLQALADTAEPHGHRYYTKSGYLGDLSAETIAGLLVSAAAQPSPLGSIDFEYLRGAIDRPAEPDTAFPRRDAPYICTFSAHWTDPAQDAANIRWARESLARSAADRSGGAYRNYLPDESEEAVLETNGANRHRRLAEIRSLYDPHGIFRRTTNDPATIRS
jgi:FAD/FMN-containing dehydrogenase